MLARRSLLVLVLAAFGCAHASSQPTASSRAGRASSSVRPRVKLAILPVESDAFPHLAAGINTLFHDVQLPGIDDYFISKVTLEVVQLSIECTDPTPACYEAVGKSLSSQKLLYGHIVPGPAPKRGKKRERVPSVTVTVTLFDVDKGAPAAEVSKQFKNEPEATQAIADLVKEVVSPTGAPTASAGGSAGR